MELQKKRVDRLNRRQKMETGAQTKPQGLAVKRSENASRLEAGFGKEDQR